MAGKKATLRNAVLSPRFWGPVCGFGAFLLGALILERDLTESFERRARDSAYRNLGPPSQPGDAVALVLVDPKSLLAMRAFYQAAGEPEAEPSSAGAGAPPGATGEGDGAGGDPWAAAEVSQVRWPWPRHFYGIVADFLRRAGARAVAFDLDFSLGTVYDREEGDTELMARLLERAGGATLAVNFKPVPELREAELASLAEEIAAEEAGLARFALEVEEERTFPYLGQVFDAAQVPHGPLLGKGASRRLGFVNAFHDPDGGIRRMALLGRYKGRLYPSLNLAVYLDLAGVREIRAGRDGQLHLDGTAVPLDAEGRLRINWYGGELTFPGYTIHETIKMALADHERHCPHGEETCPERHLFHMGWARKYPAEKVEAYKARFKDKIVLVGVNASELGDVWTNPFSEENAYPGVEVHATVLANLLGRQFLRRPGRPARYGLLFLVALAAGAGVAFTGGERRGLLVFLGLLAAYAAAAVYFFQRHVLWLDTVVPALTAFLAFGGTSLAGYLVEGRLKRRLRSTFNRVLQPQLIDHLLQEPKRLELGGETRNLTVMFTDLQGSTTLAERIPAAELVAHLNRYFSELTDIVIRHGAYLDKYMGDGAMAVWGAPVGDPGHARRAALAALELREQLGRLQEEHRRAHEVELKTRIGVQSGEMVVGMVGSRGLAHYDVIGDTVVIASRLEGANKVYGTTILLGEGCYEEAKDAIEAREVDSVVLKGKLRAIRIYEPLARKGELAASDARKRELYARALGLYRERRFEEAAAGFEEVLGLDAQDGPAQVLAARSRAYLREPPGPAWQGEHVMTAK